MQYISNKTIDWKTFRGNLDTTNSNGYQVKNQVSRTF